MTQRCHTIKQQILELHISSDVNSFELQNQISGLYRSQIVPLIDAICTQLSDPGTIYRIDHLEIDLGEIDIVSIETDFVQKSAEALSEQISQILAATTFQSAEAVRPTMSIGQVQRTSPTHPTQARLELFRGFLQIGRLPWWSKALNRNDLEECFNQLLAEAPNELEVLLQNSLKQEKIVQRILYQFSEPVHLEILKLLVPSWHRAFCLYLEDIRRLLPHVESLQTLDSHHSSQLIWQGLFLHLALQQPSTNSSTPSDINLALQANLLYFATQLKLDQRSLIQQLQTTISILTSTGNPLRSNLPQVVNTFSGTSSPVGNSEILRRREGEQTILEASLSDLEDIYIQNAGVVLLWPFLNHFFEILNLVESGQFLNLQTAHRATLFLQYLVDASLETLEPSLFLNKILCGLEPSESIPTNLLLTENEQRECEALLSATIQNWSMLGNISIAGFRQSFLQREGILRSHNEGWRLQVEQQTHDILLDHLPWSIEVVKLPWMNEIIYVEW